MIKSIIFGVLAMALTLFHFFSIAPTPPPHCASVVKLALAFLLFAEAIFFGIMAYGLNKKKADQAPFVLAFLMIVPPAYILYSSLLVPISYFFSSNTPLLVCHFIVLLPMLGIFFVVHGLASQSSKEVAAVKASRISLGKLALKLSQCAGLIRESKMDGKSDIAESIELLAEKIKYAPDGNDDSKDSDEEIAQYISELTRLAREASDGEPEEATVKGIKKRVRYLQDAYDQRQLSIMGKL